MADRCDRPPIVAIVFVFEASDEAVGHGQIYHGKQACVLPGIELARCGHFSGDPVPATWGTFVPKSCNLALFSCPSRTLAAADCPHLLDFSKSLLAIYRRRIEATELSGRLQDKWRYLTPMGHERRRKIRRCWAILARLGARCVLDRPIGAIVLSSGEDSSGRGSPNFHAGFLSRALRNSTKRLLESDIEAFFAGRQQRNECFVGRPGHGRVDRRIDWS